MDRRILVLSFLLLALPGVAPGQGQLFFGAMGGITTLSSDSRAIVSPDASRFSRYEPDNGPTFRLIGGRHFNDYFSAQASYGWNRNQLRLTASESAGGSSSYYLQTRESSQHSAMFELMLYFSDRLSFARPHVSVGGGVVHFSSGEGRIRSTEGTLPAPGAFSATEPALRVAGGIDLTLGRGWSFRYIFSETLKANPISNELTPSGEHNLKKSQNLFGIVRSF